MKRIIAGTRGSEVGLWISAPGKNAATATATEDYLLSTTLSNMRPVMWGQSSSQTLAYDSAKSVAPVPYGFTMVEGGGGAYYIFWIPGMAYYWVDITHDLGYKPVCHISFANTSPQSPSIRFRITDTKLTLFAFQYWTGRSGLYGDLFAPTPPSSISTNKLLNYTLFREAL